MAEEKNIQSKRKINSTLLAVAAIAIIAVTAIIIVAFTVPRTVKAKELEKQLDLGDKYLSELKYEQAIAAYLAAIEINPKCEDAYFALVDIYVATGEFDKAEEVLCEAEKELGEAAVREKRDEVTEKKMASVESETTTPEPETTCETSTTPELETEETSEDVSKTEISTEIEVTTPEPETTTEPPIIEKDNGVFKYIESDSGVVTITGLVDKATTQVFIPTEIDNKPVGRIGESAFLGCSELTIMEIPSEIVEIGKAAFENCANVVIHTWEGAYAEKYAKENGIPVKLKIDLTEKDNGTFRYRNNEEGGVTILGLSDKTITNLSIPNKISGKAVTEIAEAAFEKCDNLETLTMFGDDDNAVTIGESAFKKCANLKRVNIYNVEIIGKSAFENCDALEDLSISATTIGAYAFYDCDASVNSFSMRNVTVIGESAFESCGFKYIKIPESVTEIGKRAFASAYFKEITIPSSVQSIGAYAFYEIYAHCKIEIDPDNEYYIIENGVLYNKDKTILLKEINGSWDYTVPASVNEIYDDAFNDSNIGIINVEQGNTRYIVIDNALYDTVQKKLLYVGRVNEVVTILSDTREIGNSAIYHSGLKSVEIPNGVEKIGEYAFASSTWLANVKIPGSVIEISDNAFDGCGELNEIIVDESNIRYKMVDGVLYDSVQKKAVRAERDIISFKAPEGMVEICDKAFSGCESLENVEFSDGVEIIGHYAFNSCGNIKSIKLPNSVKKIGDSAFRFCSGLETVELSSDLKIIGVSAFEECNSLVSIVIPDGVEEICDNAFHIPYGNLARAIVPASVLKIGSEGFPSYSSAGLVIVTPAGSYADRYARENGINVVNQ